MNEYTSPHRHNKNLPIKVENCLTKNNDKKGENFRFRFALH
ncbi:unnamed protein product [Oikopleura dioica]|uniref:Uncharacterized protein n=1 Tax=Oikopleura dioica TaxID=34765 RepID=E4XUE1_OIKDI|nr:unnamed protein product [Oikopleura dioica]